jgi:hypothetical protein
MAGPSLLFAHKEPIFCKMQAKFDGNGSPEGNLLMKK